MMRRLFSTAEVHPRDRFEYWHAVACKHIVDHDSSPACRETFRAELQAGVLADVGVVLFENSAMTVAHTARHAAHAKADELLVCRQVTGVLALEQDGRDARLEAGDMMLLDPRLPYTGRFFGDSRLLVFRIPRHLLEARIGKAREMIGLALKSSAAVNGFTSAFLAMLPAHVGSMDQAAEEIVGNQAVDLIAVSLATAVEGRPRVSSARSLAFMNVRAAIEARLTDRGLDAATVAAAAGVSVRYANAVLAEHNTSIVRLVQSRRLARCRTALEDPLQAHRTVSEIAYSWGFSDMTHFGRKFRRAYGLLPSEYRRLTKEK